MKRGFKIVGIVWLCLALMSFGAEAVRSLEAASWQPLALGYLWYIIDPDSLGLTQAVTQRYLLPVLWDPVAIEVLRWPAWSVFGGLAAILAIIARLVPARATNGGRFRRLKT